MNVIGSRPDGWWRNRHAAMVRLVDLLERWAAAAGEDVTVMFEGPPNPPTRSTVVDGAPAAKRGANALLDRAELRPRRALGHPQHDPRRDEVHGGVEHRLGLRLAQLDREAAVAQPARDARGELLVPSGRVVDDELHPTKILPGSGR